MPLWRVVSTNIRLKQLRHDLLVEDSPFDELVCRSTSGNYDLIAANGTAAEIKLMEVFAREVR